MKNLNKIAYAIACLGLVACNSNQKIKMNSDKSNKRLDSFLVKKITDSNFVISLSYTKENLSCKSPCEISKSRSFLKLTDSNIDVLYNRKGKVISRSDNNNTKIELTDSFAKITSDSSTIIYSGYTGEKILEDKSSSSKFELSDNFLTSTNENLKIWNAYGQLMETKDVLGQKLNLFVSNSFVGYTLGFKSLVLYGINNRKLANYNYDEKRPMNIQLNNSFAYYSVGKKIGVLHAKGGQKLMNFAGRPAQAIYMNENVGGFYDISESASFWRSNGNHIVSLVKEAGLEVTQVNNSIEYRTKKNSRYKKVN